MSYLDLKIALECRATPCVQCGAMERAAKRPLSKERQREGLENSTHQRALKCREASTSTRRRTGIDPLMLVHGRHILNFAIRSSTGSVSADQHIPMLQKLEGDACRSRRSVRSGIDG
jgi:hypothetical protein